ncbi:Cyclic nucleotide-binding domain-containing protein [Actinomadura pelletieri DSM 43383]|uniref:Cyclic nucleotide-binding domain-containing protein n=1 Tax=Actinomadura pelletieri DSM 43383 TaxID=1120940 RepID=A0A495Q9G2_9ACTN|nr:cyclic nucleotide-binding domain-containing protein [Actinomadura pelletieri]RKS68128.1 Cyclic nucleotide-binding domain-containing protein [Actinomadura pelletieri DSM 43383]
MDRYTRRHDPDQIVPSETGHGNFVRQVHTDPGKFEAADAEDPRLLVAAPTAAALPPLRQGFWGALTEDERNDLLAHVEEVVYPVGTVLWFEGQAADHAVVVRSGSIRVSVNRDGHERIIAFRGPGDIVGERAALLLRRRSATIVAMETVHGLRMSTQQFVAYLSDHPRVVAIMEHEVYHRLTEQMAVAPPRAEPYRPAASPFQHAGQAYATGSMPIPRTDHATNGGLASVVPSGDSTVPAARLPPEEEPTRPMVTGPPTPASPSWAGQNCTIVYTDIAGFSAPHRNDRDRLAMRRAMYALLQEAFEVSAVPWHACHIEDRGDGALIVVPPEVPTAAVIDPMIASLAVRLRHHNERSNCAARIQLRVAVHVGPVMPDPPGVSGWALIRTARLLDARPLKDRLAATGADLGFIASTFVYESVIAHGPGHVNPAEYEPISCTVKKLRIEGWVHLRGVPAQSAV